MGITITKRPDKEVSAGYDSRWLAINGGYPVFFTLYRKDFAITSIADDGNGFSQITVAGDITAELTEGQSIFFSSASMGDYTTIITAFAFATNTTITTNHVFTATATDSDAANYLNLLGARDDYKMLLQIYGTTNNNLLFEGKYGPSPDGKVDFDVAGALIPHISNEMDEDYPGIREADTNTTQPFYIKFAEFYSGSQFDGTVDPAFYRAVNCANQLRDTYGENMGDRVAFNADITPKAKWLTDFERPKFWPGYPFDLSSIVETNGVEPTISRHEESFNEALVSQATNFTNYPAGSDFSYPQRNATFLSTYPNTVCEVDVWLETDGTGDICAALATLSQAQKWNFQQAQVDPITGELLAIYIEANPLSGISSIDTHPQMTVTDGTNVWAYEWNATQGYYEAVAGPNYVTQYTNYTFSIASIDVTIYGQSCTTSFQQSYVFTESLASPPVASAGSVVADGGALKNGNDVTISYTYNDDESSPQDLASTVVELWYFDTSGGSGGAKIADLTHVSGSLTDNGVRTMDPYTVPVAAIGKYIGVKITPVATVQPTTGDEYIYVDPRIVVNNTAAVVLPTDNTDPTPFEFDVSIKSGAPYYLEFSDGSAAEYYVGTGALGGHDHSFSGVSTPHTCTVCCDPTDVLGLNAPSSGLNGTVDLSQCTELDGVLDLNGNANLTACTLPTTGTPVLSKISLKNTGITAFDMGSVRGNGTNYLFLQNCSSLASFAQNTGVSDVLYLGIQLQSTAVTTVDVSNFNSAVLLAISSNASLTSITYPSANATTVTSFQVHNCGNLTGTQDLSGCTGGFRGIFYAYSTDISGFTFPAKSAFDTLAASSLFITDFRVQGSNLSNPDFSNVTNLSGRVLMGNQSLGTVTFAASAYSGTFSELNIGSGGISSTLDLSSLVNWTDTAAITLSSNSSLSSITGPTMLAGKIQTFTVASCDFATNANIGWANMILATSSVDFNISTNSLPATEVDAGLAFLDTELTAGTGDIDFSGNTAPTAAGDTSAANLVTDGYTVTTD